MTRHLRRYLYLEALAEQADGWEPPGLGDALLGAWERLGPREVAWLQRRVPGASGSPHEEEARRRKAQRIAEAVPAGLTAERLARMAWWERDRVAGRAGCRSPSAETWRLVVEEIRER